MGGKIIKYRCRCLGYDSPEMKPLLTLENRDEIKKKAILARDKFSELLLQDSTITIKCGKFEKYGRLLVNVYNNTNGEKSLNQIMIDEKHGYEYFGGKKQ